MPGFGDDYVDVAERLVEFYDRHPEGSLRPADPAKPYWFEEVDGQTYLVYAAAAYRTPDDTLPGIGLAWEVVPGKTNFTRTSELMNAETSAWGRALVALGIAAKRGIASKQEVRSAQDRTSGPGPKRKKKEPTPEGEPFGDSVETVPPEVVDALLSEIRNSSEPVRLELKAFMAAKELPALSAHRDAYPAPLFKLVESKLSELQDEADAA